MDKEREIKELAAFFRKPPSICGTEQCSKNCYNCIAESIINIGYGDTKQAVREFAEKVKSIIDDLVELIFDDGQSRCIIGGCHKADDIPCGSSICIEENKQAWKSKIDRLLAEVTGE